MEKLLRQIGTAVLCVAMMTSPATLRAQDQAAKERPAAEVQKPQAAANKPEPLTEKEQSQLANRSEEPGKEVAGGALSNLHLTYIVIALATAVIVLVAK